MGGGDISPYPSKGGAGSGKKGQSGKGGKDGRIKDIYSWVPSQVE